jgi:hypothetical protein
MDPIKLHYAINRTANVILLVNNVFSTYKLQYYNKRASNIINPLTPELNPSAQRCLTRFFTGDFAS